MNRSDHKGLKYQFLVIASLVFVLPFLILFYIFYQANISFDSFHLIVFALILLLILAGLMLIRYIFDSIYSAARSLKEATESGTVISMDLKKEVVSPNHC